MHQLGIGEVQPTLITGNECEDGAHPFTVTTMLDGKKTPAEIPTVAETGAFDWSNDFFNKRVFLTVSRMRRFGFLSFFKSSLCFR